MVMFPQVQGLGLILREMRHVNSAVIYAYVISSLALVVDDCYATSRLRL
jgi:hypothetical protein